MSIVKSGKLGNIHADREKLLREEIIDKYQHVGGRRKSDGSWNEGREAGQNWLVGLSGNKRDNIALLYENQAKFFVNENTTSDSVGGGFEAVAFPMIRRIFSRLLANDIVSVQAMTQPSGALFFFYPNISDRIEDTNEAGQTVSAHAPNIGKKPACLLVGTNCPDVTFQSCKSLYDRFYSDELYDHSKGTFTIVTASGSPVMLDSDGCWVAASAMTLAQDNSVRQVKFAIDGFLSRPSGLSRNFTNRVTGAMGYEVDTEEFLATLSVINAGAPILDPNGKVIYNTGDNVNFRLPAQAYGKQLADITDICDENGTLYIEIDLTHPNTDCEGCGTYDGYIGAATGTTFAAEDLVFAWRRYNSLENETEIGEVTFEIKKVTVSVEPRKLRARWTPEMAQDINSYHGIDAEAELTALLSEQIAMEIDRQILRELKRGAAWKLRWDYYGWKLQGSQKYTQKEWNQTLITKINQISAQIHKSTLRGGANFIVVSSEVSAIFDDLDVFVPTSTDLEEYTYNLGMKQIGTVNGRYKVYVDPYANPYDVLIGHKGTSLLDTGYIYAPYLPLQLTPTITDPDTLTNVKGIATRYATKMVNNRYYGVVRVDRIQVFDPVELR
jgi:hypothetical protein